MTGSPPSWSSQADRWTWLIIAYHAQLRLARALAADLRHPWERPAPPGRLTPARVRRGFRNIRAKAVSTTTSFPGRIGRAVLDGATGSSPADRGPAPAKSNPRYRAETKPARTGPGAAPRVTALTVTVSGPQMMTQTATRRDQ